MWAGDRERSRFRNARAGDDQLSMTDATSRLIRECRLLGAANLSWVEHQRRVA